MTRKEAKEFERQITELDMLIQLKKIFCVYTFAVKDSFRVVGETLLYIHMSDCIISEIVCLLIPGVNAFDTNQRSVEVDYDLLVK